MSATAVHTAPPTEARAVVHRTRGTTRGPLTRLASPADLGALIKPFVFLDYFDSAPGEGPRFGFHPHSGIATVTLLLEGGLWFEEMGGLKGTLDGGDIEWMCSGSGVFHAGGHRGEARTKGFQLWVALPPDLENAPPESRYVKRAELPRVGPARLVLGEYLSARSPIPSPEGIAYLSVELKAGERWRYETPAGHDVGWMAVHFGEVHIDEPVESGELVVLSFSDAAISVEAVQDSAFVLGSARRHPYPLVMGPSSVHTNPEALAYGLETIRKLRASVPHQPGAML